jgi:hypothetical protein
MVWEGYRSRLCKCNNFNENGLFGRDNASRPPWNTEEFLVVERIKLRRSEGLRSLAANRIRGKAQLFLFSCHENVTVAVEKG